MREESKNLLIESGDIENSESFIIRKSKVSKNLTQR